MKLTATAPALVCAMLTCLPVERGLAFSAEGTASVSTCAGGFVDNDGGVGFATALAAAALQGGACPPYDDAGYAIGAGMADIANGFVFARGDADGPLSSSVLSDGRFADFLFIDAPPGVDSVEIAAAIDLVADYTGAYDFSQEFLFGRVSISSVGQIEIRRCTPAICPDAPIQSDSVSQVFTVNRMFNGQFPQIDVNLQATLAVINGGGYFSGHISVAVVDDSGATLSSHSGVWGTGTGYDTDADAIPDALDNCRLVPNADQRDTNGDGFGNICDPDLDDDLSVNFSDLGLLKTVFFTADEDADFDGDGNVNFGDLGLMKERFFGAPGPGAAVP